MLAGVGGPFCLYDQSIPFSGVTRLPVCNVYAAAADGDADDSSKENGKEEGDNASD